MIKAQKDYKPFEVVFECQLFVHKIDYQYKGQVCDNCLTKSDGLKRCSVCKHMYYCDRNCQRKDWRTGHRYECQIFKNHYQKLVDEYDLASLLLRLYLIIKADPQIVYKMYDTVDGKQRCFADLMTHREEILQNKRKVNLILDIHKRISSCGVELTVDDLVNLFVFQQLCGGGIFIGASVLDHSCTGNRLQIIANQNVTAGDELTINYANLLWTTDRRRKLLKVNYFFDCHCRRCVDGIVDDNSIENMIKAQKDYKPNEVVLECPPFVHIIYNQYKGQICDHCLVKSDGLKKCANCGHMYYCNRNCQRNDWRAGHRYECQIFKNHSQKLFDENNLCPTILRLYLISKSDPKTGTTKGTTLLADNSDVSMI
ncbi:N-lysine methyltransferase SMYD2-B-like [Oppia nitens]|uniref:N-lysine methyltransferase SMYD2-B-like n=1 Tax=Oppia nitens TaxID=1686743 RepID=UPI0023DBD2AA|nr:N-lysine methyltransferase SMYD2-B-like [Oppia nitens]